MSRRPGPLASGMILVTELAEVAHDVIVEVGSGCGDCPAGLSNRSVRQPPRWASTGAPGRRTGPLAVLADRGRMFWEISTAPSQASSSSALAISRSRVSSMSARISPAVTADRSRPSTFTCRTRRATVGCGSSRRSSDTTLVSSRYTTRLEARYGTGAVLRPRRDPRIRAGLRREQQLLQLWPSPPLHLPPLADGHQDGCLPPNPPSGDDLGAFGHARLNQLAETCLGILHLPSLAHPALTSIQGMTGQQTKPGGSEGEVNRIRGDSSCSSRGAELHRPRVHAMGSNGLLAHNVLLNIQLMY